MLAIEKQGQVIRVVNLTPQNPPKATPSKRGNVEIFSRKSRRRMIDVQSRLDLSNVRATFITLTFHYTHSAKETKLAFRRFRAWLDYHYPQSSGIWRIEFQKRSTPHYHLILFNFPYVEHSTLRQVWMKCTREDASGVRVNLLKNERHAMYYVSKYVAKFDAQHGTTLFINAPYCQKSEEQWTGRMWGIMNRECLPFATRQTGVIVDEEVASYFWSMASLTLTRPSDFRRHTTRLYREDAQQIFNWLLSLGGFEATDSWRLYLREKQLSPSQRTKASHFFAGVDIYH